MTAYIDILTANGKTATRQFEHPREAILSSLREWRYSRLDRKNIGHECVELVSTSRISVVQGTVLLS